MRFWDASAVVPLLLEEDRTTELSALLGEDAEMLVWWATSTECTSAVRRREREGALDAGGARLALSLLAELREAWSEVQPVEEVRAAAERALAVHPLRAADSLQLGAALTWGRAGGAGPVEMVCLDQVLSDAAHREGLAVLPA